jgi:hypothetical protein
MRPSTTSAAAAATWKKRSRRKKQILKDVVDRSFSSIQSDVSAAGGQSFLFAVFLLFLFLVHVLLFLSLSLLISSRLPLW